MPKNTLVSENRNQRDANSNDYYFRILLCLISAYVITMYNEDLSFYQAILLKPQIYVRSLTASFIIAYLLTGYIGYVSSRLDKMYDWFSQTIWRVLWQFFLGYLLPAVAAFLLVAGYFALYGFNVLQTNYLKEDYSLVLLMLLVFNLFVICLSFFRREETKLQSQPESTVAEVHENRKNAKEVVIVDTPLKSIPVRVEDISYIFILDGSVFLRTKEMATLGESYQVSSSLKSLEEELDPSQFFRINRQMIVSFASCISYRPSSAKNIDLSLSPPPYPTGVKIPAEHRRLTVVSEDRTSAFKSWMNR